MPDKEAPSQVPQGDIPADKPSGDVEAVAEIPAETPAAGVSAGELVPPTQTSMSEVLSGKPPQVPVNEPAPPSPVPEPAPVSAPVAEPERIATPPVQTSASEPAHSAPSVESAPEPAVPEAATSSPSVVLQGGTQEGTPPVGEPAPSVPPPVVAVPPVSPPPPAAPVVSAPPPPTKLPQDILLARRRVALREKQDKRLQRVLDAVREQGSISNDEVEKILHVSHATSYRYLRELVRAGKLCKSGTTRDMRYELCG